MTLGAPLPLTPRLDAKPWGGRALERFGFPLPDGAIGEALITAPEALVSEGAFARRSLGDVVASNPDAALGARSLTVTRGLSVFPLLIKIIDAREDLSIQVHPDDFQAPPGSLGKTEAWHVLAAEPGASLYLGLLDGVTKQQLADLARQGTSTAHLMRRVPAIEGTTVFLPAGTVHALGAGVVIYEIQQPSAITYRFDDWGRVDKHGRSRELHVEQGLEVLRPDVRPEPIAPKALPGGGNLLVGCSRFALERFVLAPNDARRLDGAGAPWAVTCLSGSAIIETSDGSTTIHAGGTAALLACAGSTTVTAGDTGATILRGWLDPSITAD